MLTKAEALAHTVIYRKNSRFDKVKEKSEELTLIGKGRSAYVFALTEGGRKMALKVFFRNIKRQQSKKQRSMKN